MRGTTPPTRRAFRPAPSPTSRRRRPRPTPVERGPTWRSATRSTSSRRSCPRASTSRRRTTLAVYATRNLTDILGKNYYDNLEHDFRPDGQPVTDTWDKTTNAACNRCHNTLSAHGGSRQDIKLCVTCHQPQTIDPDTGNTVDFKVMVHKIHRGESLPSVEAGTPYVIIGNSQSVHDFSNVVFPQDIRNCVRCHTPEATQNHVWYTYPPRRPVRRLPRRHQLGHGRESRRRTGAGRRLPVRLLPPSRRGTGSMTPRSWERTRCPTGRRS